MDSSAKSLRGPISSVADYRIKDFPIVVLRKVVFPNRGYKTNPRPQVPARVYMVTPGDVDSTPPKLKKLASSLVSSNTLVLLSLAKSWLNCS